MNQPAKQVHIVYEIDGTTTNLTTTNLTVTGVPGGRISAQLTGRGKRCAHICVYDTDGRVLRALLLPRVWSIDITDTTGEAGT